MKHKSPSSVQQVHTLVLRTWFLFLFWTTLPLRSQVPVCHLSALVLLLKVELMLLKLDWNNKSWRVWILVWGEILWIFTNYANVWKVEAIQKSCHGSWGLLYWSKWHSSLDHQGIIGGQEMVEQQKGLLPKFYFQQEHESTEMADSDKRKANMMCRKLRLSNKKQVN